VNVVLAIVALGAVVLILRESMAGSVTATCPGACPGGGGILSSLFTVSCPMPASSVSGAAVSCPSVIDPFTSDPASWPSGDALWNVAQAIAYAEGANVRGSAPDRFNNPGDLSKGDEHGQVVSGYTTLSDGENLIIFATKTNGWTALYTKLQGIDQGRSSVYSGDMTWNQIGQSYAGNSATWAQNVAARLGVDPNSTFNSYVDVCGCGACGPACG
jgi:hypothetical protein